MLDFLGIGAQKCGTTWLYSLLEGHPEIFFPPAKEIHFWNRQNLPIAPDALAWYQRLFDVPEARGRKRGEITPAYGFLPTPMIERIRQEMPEVRLFYIIRDPVARAWSSALMALGRAEMTIEEASDQWFIDHFRSAGSRVRGDYAQCLDHWLSVFPQEQLLLLEYKDIAAKPEQLLTRLAAHLRVDAAPLLASPKLRTKAFEGPGHSLRPSLKPVLEEIYAEPTRRLKERYGIVFTPSH